MKIYNGEIKLKDGSKTYAFFIANGDTVLRVEPYGIFETEFVVLFQFFPAYQGDEMFDAHIETMEIEFDHDATERYLQARLNQINEEYQPI